jgi:hypothetical protein
VSGGGNESILVWDVATNKTEFNRVPVSFKRHGKSVWSVVSAPDSGERRADIRMYCSIREHGQETIA